MAARTLIGGAQVLVGDPSRGGFERVDVLVEDGRIAALGLGLDSEAERIDASGGLLLPGFVDTHRHVWQTAMRGICAEWTLLDYFRGIRIGAATDYTPEDVYAGQLAGGLDALDSGVTCLLDFSHCLNSPDHSDEAVRGLRDAGLRATFAYGMFPVPLAEPALATAEARFGDARRLGGSIGGLLRMGVALTELGLVPFETSRGEVALARELEALVTAHTGTVWSPDRPPEVEILAEAGLLDAGQVHVHCNACSDGELDLLAGAGASVSVTPETELQMGMGFPVTARVVERGMTPSLGADIVSNNSGDLFTQMRLGLGCERARANEPLLREQRMPETLTVSAADMLGWATLGGARALGLESEIGSIVEGKAADLVLLRSEAMPPAEPVAQTVLQSSVRDVEAVMVAGELVKRDGRLASDAAERAGRLAAESRERIFAAAQARGGLLPPAPEGFLEMTIGAMRHNLAGAPGMEG